MTLMFLTLPPIYHKFFFLDVIYELNESLQKNIYHQRAEVV